MTDMADNANKMGTAMDSIQNAYQGFAKQNYTMLDNLKIGYGGTKEEMERLLADAQQLSGCLIMAGISAVSCGTISWIRAPMFSRIVWTLGRILEPAVATRASRTGSLILSKRARRLYRIWPIRSMTTPLKF